VNCWLEEGAVNLGFKMYENPKSIEFNTLYDREAYISYPPGVLFPPFIVAKIMGKKEIQSQFLLDFLEYWFLLDTLLVCLLFYAIFTVCLRLRNKNAVMLSSAALSIIWMCLPDNLFWLRNVFFADQCIITVVLLFLLLEIYTPLVEQKSKIIKYIFVCFKFLIVLYGVLTDYYFLFVIFVAWIVRIAPLFRLKQGKWRNIIEISLIYVLPVILGLGLFLWQISTVSGYYEWMKWKMDERTVGINSGGKSMFLLLVYQFVKSYTVIGSAFICLCVILLIYTIIKAIKHKTPIFDRSTPLQGIGTVICLPPIVQSLVLLNHSAIHLFTMTKFSFPFIFSILAFIYFLTGRYNKMRNKPGFLCGTLITSAFITALIVIFHIFGSFGYLKKDLLVPNSYELAHLIRDNYSYEDVYFSFTDSIPINPPEALAVSKKRVWKINDLSDIDRLFPHLDGNANCLIVINKASENKTSEIISEENAAVNCCVLRFNSDNYAVYQIDN
jgi:hypothetical protein